jgi:uncharacterized membrane protein required for colicin V production
MNWVDIIIVLVAVLFGGMGWWRGVVQALFGIGGLIGGIVLAGRLYQSLAPKLSSEGAIWAGVAAYALILVLTIAAASIAGWFVAKAVHALPFGWVDRLLGAVIGVFLGCLLVGAILALLCLFSSTVEAAVARSALAELIMKSFPLLRALLPGSFDFLREMFT